MSSAAQARFLRDGCNRCGHMRGSHYPLPTTTFTQPSWVCRTCAKSYPQGAHHAFEPHTRKFEEISDYERAGYTKDEARDNLEAERDE